MKTRTISEETNHYLDGFRKHLYDQYYNFYRTKPLQTIDSYLQKHNLGSLGCFLTFGIDFVDEFVQISANKRNSTFRARFKIYIPDSYAFKMSNDKPTSIIYGTILDISNGWTSFCFTLIYK
jgi:hypothetical protein